MERTTRFTSIAVTAAALHRASRRTDHQWCYAGATPGEKALLDTRMVKTSSGTTTLGAMVSQTVMVVPRPVPPDAHNGW